MIWHFHILGVGRKRGKRPKVKKNQKFPHSTQRAIKIFTQGYWYSLLKKKEKNLLTKTQGYFPKEICQTVKGLHSVQAFVTLEGNMCEVFGGVLPACWKSDPQGGILMGIIWGRTFGLMHCFPSTKIPPPPNLVPIPQPTLAQVWDKIAGVNNFFRAFTDPGPDPLARNGTRLGDKIRGGDGIGCILCAFCISECLLFLLRLPEP